MAKEIQFYGNPDNQSGLTLSVDIFDSNGIEVSSNISVPEIGNSAIYIADMPILQADNYIVRFFTPTSFIAQGSIEWDGTKEISADTMIKDVWQIQGLDKNNTMTMIPGQRSAGSIILDVAGDGETISVVTRQ